MKFANLFGIAALGLVLGANTARADDIVIAVAGPLTGQLAVAERFARRWDVPLHVERGAGHWACNERAQQLAGVLRARWAR